MKRKTSFTLFATLLVSVILFTGCSGNKNRVLTVDQLMADAETLTGETVTVEGLCSHVCAKSGMKLFLVDDNDDQSIRVESNGTLGKFDKEAVDKKVRVTGKLVEERIDEAYLQEMEKEINDSTVVTHGEGAADCETEQKAEGIAAGSSEMERVNDFRARIAERKAAEGKDYLSFYHIAADSYRIIKE